MCSIIQNFAGANSALCYNVVNDGAVDVDSGHGTHVAGSVLSDGGTSGEGKGVAPAARLVFQAVEEASSRRGYFAVVATCGDDPADERRATETLLDRNVDGVILATARLDDELPASLRARDIPHVLALRLEIIDDGRGVPEALAERIFLPLVSGHAAGTGLGLALAQQVAREHRGSLAYRSRPGHTVFTLLLPLWMEAEEQDGA